MTALYQNRQIRQLETYAIQHHIHTEQELMQLAGQAAFTALQTHWPNAKHITVFCGKGNNGGDGYVVARLAYQHGLQVTLVALAPLTTLSGAALAAAKACVAAGVAISTSADLTQSDVIVDALLGTGLQGEVRQPFLETIQQINQSHLPVLALDIPSGLAADSGEILGDAIKADITLTFIGLKQGLFTHKGPSVVGQVACDTLDLPAAAFATVTPTVELLDYSALKHLLPQRPRDAHKGDHGHVLVIGGDYGMGGAVRMAAEAALRAGAGLVTVATRPEHVSVVNCQRPEIMCQQVANGEDLLPLLERATVVVIGPGLGKSDWAKALLTTVLTTTLPKLLDADALNLLSQMPQKRSDWVLTPHPGEASRLLDCSNSDIQADRFKAAGAIQQQYGGVVVLKGVGTLIKTEHSLEICPAGNPGMATAGMGDVLSGVIGGLLAQKLPLAQAAAAGVLVHALAGDRAAVQGGERGLLATDLMQPIRELVNPK